VSDQDFFFEEEPAAPKRTGKGAKSTAAPSSAKAGASTAVPPAPKPGPSAPLLIADQSTTWAIASLLAVAALLLGAILGFLLGTGLAKSRVAVPAASVPAASAPAASATPAQLTSEQVRAGLPAGHPAISVPASGSAVTTK
jgi:hypothetical protein